ncbi:MAG TPA: hypothetical protein VMZ05_02035 [Spirochaetota bacterium]|nr:hypothetical protein [Spirochaetota bacterium]
MRNNKNPITTRIEAAISRGLRSKPFEISLNMYVSFSSSRTRIRTPPETVYIVTIPHVLPRRKKKRWNFSRAFPV